MYDLHKQLQLLHFLPLFCYWHINLHTPDEGKDRRGGWDEDYSNRMSQSRSPSGVVGIWIEIRTGICMPSREGEERSYKDTALHKSRYLMDVFELL